LGDRRRLWTAWAQTELTAGQYTTAAGAYGLATTLGAIYGIALRTLIGTVGLILNGVAGYLPMSTPIRRVIERALKGRSAEATAELSDRAGL
jgi:hypothetical protein